ncbi:MAG: ATP-binding protein [Turicibacter sp.]|nr:ATP-binding protein [Turicibacter sp.]
MEKSSKLAIFPRHSGLILSVLFVVAIVYMTVAFNNINALHRYKIDYVSARTAYLLEFYQEFINIRHLVREMLAEPEYQQIYADLESLYTRLNGIAAAYTNSLITDPVLDENISLELILITEILAYIDKTYELIRDFSETDVSMPIWGAIVVAEDTLLELMQLSNAEAESTLASIDYSLSNMQMVIYALVAVMLILLGLLALTSRAMAKTITQAKNLYWEKIRKSPPAWDGEISHMITETANMFADMVADINEITTQNRHGNTDARLATAKLYGIYTDVATAINTLLDIIVYEKKISQTRKLMFDSAPIVMTVLDKDLNILECNEEAFLRYGFASKEEYGMNFFDASPERQPDGSLSVEKGAEWIQKCYENGSVQFEWLHQTAKGEPIPSEVQCFTINYNDENVVLAYSIDLRELKKNMKLAQAAEAALENSQMKSRFLARMSHEIRTPIAAVLGISEIHLRKTLPLELEEAFAKIYNSASILLNIVNDILDLSKIEAGKMTITPDEYDTASMLSDVIHLNLAFLGSKDIKFIVQADENIPAALIGSELRIKQVLNNLLSNSFKYTVSGSVTFTIIAQPIEGSNHANLTITIEDTGHGMTPEQLESLFNEYAQFQEKDIKLSFGTGLGMPITHNLLQLMGGNIEVESEFGVGTKITVTIPQELVDNAVLGEERASQLNEFQMDSKSAAQKLSFTPKPMPYGRVLVVDDVDTNLYVARGFLDMYELQIETCESGFEAIEKVRTGEKYDIIFMDHMMPELDGMETTAQLREMGYTLPIVALTANALIGQAEEFLKNGFNGFISKPIRATPLDVVLTKFIKDKEDEDDRLAGFDFSDFDEDFEEEEFTASPEIMTKIRADFLESQRDVIPELRQALADEDYTLAYRLAHNLKNLAGMMNERELARLAEIIERECGDESVNDETVEELKGEVNRILAELL